ncbi:MULTISPECIES: precorrin-6A reductase [unclassified Carboxydocella]|uniref:precorrin-6A reductase n=1 Tax=unclassified Carboxydocella TaxID=2685367 RepID=UPI0009ACB5A3|nr:MULTISPECIES: precorrin-6A reductase [unclassified Carboxydocella]GAW27909.1 precorrin-6x reductase [Carboxydocella sp. ULO1]GAW31514.1 precorrin-6x reductase [Carboxydocella sp. JDF658]
MILILGGTTEAKEAAVWLKKNTVPFVVTTTTELGRKQLLSEGIENILVTKLNEITFTELIHKLKVNMILDATHPFAEQIHQLAIDIARKMNLPYLRYQRQDVELNNNNPYIIVCHNWEEAIKQASKFNCILLTIGVKRLNEWGNHPLLQTKKLYARVLPVPESISTALDAGFSPQNLFAMYGPVPAAIDLSIIRSYKIDVMVTKESGYNGGLQNKIQAVTEAGIHLILIKKPQLNLTIITDLNELKSVIEKGDINPCKE